MESIPYYLNKFWRLDCPAQFLKLSAKRAALLKNCLADNKSFPTADKRQCIPDPVLSLFFK